MDLSEQANANAEEATEDTAEVDNGEEAELESEVNLGNETDEDLEVCMAGPFAAVGGDRDADAEPKLGNNQELASDETKETEFASLDSTDRSIKDSFDINDDRCVVSTTDASVKQAELNIDGSLKLGQDVHRTITTIAVLAIAVSSTAIRASSTIGASSAIGASSTIGVSYVISTLLDNGDLAPSCRDGNGRSLDEETKREKNKCHSEEARHGRLEGHCKRMNEQ